MSVDYQALGGRSIKDLFSEMAVTMIFLVGGGTVTFHDTTDEDGFPECGVQLRHLFNRQGK